MVYQDRICLRYEFLISVTPKHEMNGAGQKGFGWLVPDRLGMVNIEKAANIHDACYYWLSKGDQSVFPYDREFADKIFYENMQIINEEMSPTRIGYLMRKPIIWTYYQAVKRFGGKYVKK